MTHDPRLGRPTQVRLIGLVSLIAASSVLAEDFTLEAGPEGLQCLRARQETSTVVSVFTEDVLTRDGLLFVARGPYGVSVLGPDGKERSHVALDARGLSLQGSLLWVRGDGIRIAVIDVAEPSAARLLGSYAEDPAFAFGWIEAIATQPGLLWVGRGNSLEVYDVRKWNAPVFLARQALTANTLGLRFEGDLLLIEYPGPQTSVWNVKDPLHPVTLGPTLNGRILGGYLVEREQISQLEFHDDRAPSLTPIAALGPRDQVVAIAAGRLFLRHDSKALSVLELPSLAFIGGVMGNFETGSGPVVRSGAALFFSTRFGGLQRVALEFEPETPARRFSNTALERNRFHGDLIGVVVEKGDSVARLLQRYQLEDPSIDWAHRMEPLERLNNGSHPDLAKLRVGSRLGLPLPRTLLCRP